MPPFIVNKKRRNGNNLSEENDLDSIDDVDRTVTKPQSFFSALLNSALIQSMQSKKNKTKFRLPCKHLPEG